MSELNKSFSELLKSDSLHFEVNPSIEHRLMYHFQLKTASSKIKRNHVVPFLDNLFSSRYVGLKIGLATLLIALAIGFRQLNAPKEINLQADTAAVFNFHDTLSFIPSNDSVSIN
jgi:hypothetical protein